MCELCDIVENRKFGTKKYFEDANYVMINCKSSLAPMLICKKHQGDIDEADKLMMYHMFYKHAERIDISKWYVDYNTKNSEHWHCYLRRK